jgi:hypothetical protein
MKPTKPMSNAAMQRLLKSDFFWALRDVIRAWDFYVAKNEDQNAFQMQCKWEMAKLALEHMTGKTYHFSRTDTHYGVVSGDGVDKLFFEKRI